MHFTFTSKNIPKKNSPNIIQETLLKIKKNQNEKKGSYVDMVEVLRVPFDSDILHTVRLMVKKKYTTSLKYIFVVGIGGSSLGTQAITEALYSEDKNIKIVYLESVDSKHLLHIKDLVNKLNSSDEFVINLVSKAGSTTETIANFSILIDMVSHLRNYNTRVVVTTTRDSDLSKLSIKEKYDILFIPNSISGRYSVLTPVGLFPLCMAGYPVESLLEGARMAGESIGTIDDASKKFAENIFSCMSDGAHIVDFFFFNPELEALGKWTRQLYGESLGKSKTLSGLSIRNGITPTVTIGTDDLHSMFQLYMAGPKDKITLLVPPIVTKKIIVPPNPFTSLIPGLAEKNNSEINSSIYTGVNAAYNKNGISFSEAHFSELNMHMIGYYMQWQMQVVVSLASALNIFAFDQPNIEDYKKVTRALLSN